jgi:hypothetical protein
MNSIAEIGPPITRLSRMTKRQLIAEAHRQGKHVTVLHPPLPQWSKDELIALLAPVQVTA